MAGEIGPSGSRRSWLSSGAASLSRSLQVPSRRSTASRDDGGEEENLPTTYARMRRGIIRKELDAGADEVDIANLNPREGRELMERVFKAVEDDNERFLRRFRDRLDQ